MKNISTTGRVRLMTGTHARAESQRPKKIPDKQGAMTMGRTSTVSSCCPWLFKKAASSKMHQSREVYVSSQSKRKCLEFFKKAPKLSKPCAFLRAFLWWMQMRSKKIERFERHSKRTQMLTVEPTTRHHGPKTKLALELPICRKKRNLQHELNKVSNQWSYQDNEKSNTEQTKKNIFDGAASRSLFIARLGCCVVPGNKTMLRNTNITRPATVPATAAAGPL